ncbi:hypothetical protein HK098_006827 [Nowakowskiella sp. JEL0407]|nr:hypothetical protein HK098_006827 [Nowakowskiella sp. JEL0407]
MPKTDEKISESIIAVVNSLDVQKLSAITTDTSLNMRNAWTVIENEFKHVFVGGCALTELDLLLKALVEIPAYAAVLKDVEFVARGIWECL